MPISGTLTLAQIIDVVTEERNWFTRKKATETVEILLASDDDLLIPGSDNFCVKKKRWGRNPATGTCMMLRPCMIVTFQCLGKLKQKNDDQEYLLMMAANTMFSYDSKMNTRG